VKISTLVSIHVPQSAATAFALATDSNRFPEFFPGYGIIPAIVRNEWLKGEQRVIGSLCKVHSADGSAMVEEVIAYDPPNRVASKLVSAIVPPFSWLITTGIGTWRFVPGADGTLIKWGYDFEVRSLLSYPAALVVLNFFLARAMQRCLKNMARALGQGTAKP
jgi:ribosome-associated toxin RatA of RatAB toxin-antitoxin module